MNHPYTALIQRYCRKGILVDTNILLLLLVGDLDPRRISTFKNTSSHFAVEDYDTLSAIVKQCPSIIVTTHILTEVSNLLGQFGDPLKADYFQHFVSKIRLFHEDSILSANISDTAVFRKLGLTDSAIIHLAKELDYLVLTIDFSLYSHLERHGVAVINYNHLRAYR